VYKSIDQPDKLEILAGTPRNGLRFVPVLQSKISFFIADFEPIGEHDFPFSFLLPGHLPATMHGGLSSIDYVLKAQATTKAGDIITFNRELTVKRSIQPSELPRQSIRIFPPTNLTAHVKLPSVIHPIGEFKCSLRVDGIVKRNVETRIQQHWKVKRLTWRIEETQKVISPACPKHAAKAGAGPDEKNGVAHEDIKNLNIQELKTGWKADYTSGPDSSVEMEFPFSVWADSNPQCDVKAEDGTEISHSLVIELIVAEEVAPITKPSHATPTGAARVLRMNFNLPITERSGLGVSWDEEQPPLYENVPASPPGFGGTEEYTGPAIPDYDELETLRD
jgi:arrestin-related trafficking adapter 1